MWNCVTNSESLKDSLVLSEIYLREQGQLYLNMDSETRIVNFCRLNKGFNSKLAKGSPDWGTCEKGRGEQGLMLVIITIKMKTLV